MSTGSVSFHYDYIVICNDRKHCMLSSVKEAKKVYGYLYDLNSCNLVCQLFVIIYQTIRFRNFFKVTSISVLKLNNEVITLSLGNNCTV